MRRKERLNYNTEPAFQHCREEYRAITSVHFDTFTTLLTYNEFHEINWEPLNVNNLMHINISQSGTPFR